MVCTRVPQLLSVLALTGAVLLAGCTEFKDAVAGPDPEPTATAFVEALAAQDLAARPRCGWSVRATAGSRCGRPRSSSRPW